MTIQLPCPLGALFDPDHSGRKTLRLVQYDILQDGRPALRCTQYPNSLAQTMTVYPEWEQKLVVDIPDIFLTYAPGRTGLPDPGTQGQWCGLTLKGGELRYMYRTNSHSRPDISVEIPELDEYTSQLLADPTNPETYDGENRSILSITAGDHSHFFFYSTLSSSPILHLAAIRAANLRPGTRPDPSYPSVLEKLTFGDLEMDFQQDPWARVYTPLSYEFGIGQELERSIGKTTELANRCTVNLDNGYMGVRYNRLLTDAEPITIHLKDAMDAEVCNSSVENAMESIRERLQPKDLEALSIAVNKPFEKDPTPEITVLAMVEEIGGPVMNKEPQDLPCRWLDESKPLYVRAIESPRTGLVKALRLDITQADIYAAELNNLAWHLSVQTELERLKFDAFMEHFSKEDIILSPRQCIRLARQLDDITLCPDISNPEDYARHIALPNILKGKALPEELPIHYDLVAEWAMPFDALFHEGNMIIGKPEIEETGRRLTESLSEPYTPLLRVCLDNHACTSGGTWINLPLSMDELETGWLHLPRQEGNTIANATEVYIALQKLGVSSLDQCKILRCETSYPWLTAGFDGHYTSVSDMLWAANNACHGIEELCSKGNSNWMKKLHAVMQFTDCQNFHHLADLTQNMDLFVTADSKSEIVRLFLEQKGHTDIPDDLLESADLDSFIFVHKDEIKTTAHGYTMKGGGDMIYSYYKSEGQLEESPTM